MLPHVTSNSLLSLLNKLLELCSSYPPTVNLKKVAALKVEIRRGNFSFISISPHTYKYLGIWITCKCKVTYHLSKLIQHRDLIGFSQSDCTCRPNFVQTVAVCCRQVANSVTESLLISKTQGDSTQQTASWLYFSFIPIQQECCWGQICHLYPRVIPVDVLSAIIVNITV